MIEVDRVTMRYPMPKRYLDYLFRPFVRRYATAVVNVSLKIDRGGCIGILGANGAGKTTLLKLIGGLIYPSCGTITVDGHDTRRENQEVRQNVGYVLNEERSFYWRLSGVQNLDFFGALDNLPRRKRRHRITELLSLVGLRDAGDVRVGNYSCGMRQRLAIARGLLANPDFLILDEPTKSLDPMGADKLRCLISKDIHNNSEKTLIIATHSLDEAEQLCDHVCVMREGQLLKWCSVKEAVRNPGRLRGFYVAATSQTKPVEC